MHFPSFTSIAVVALAFSSTTSAYCFKTGQSYADKNKAKGYVSGICNSWHNQELAPSQVVSTCKDGGSGTRVNFSLTNQSGSKSRVNTNDCINRFTAEINNCNKGSRYDAGNFHYRVDPNKGGC
ncbi:uncharacterized protein K452DRAFT_259563 [Aplosporella prunicola CBS 121167]|uniref:Glycan binding protein Y3-like domain-containing protein n=1 Tax=Aplosporella prunicola CBS 121167 TaxID=1176127 RepID=A0A6A6AZF2_9PEZI|nr:uncharacterized protein K452DRAFT_259563 [Aplosporella prunicola CBS 121167]KAF2136157.1 hypothetical protein K452DRAFT_259563 [Aplosporella prunicola CBS 121167]